MGQVLRIAITDLATPALRYLERVLNNTRGLNRAAAEGALPAVQGRFREMASSNQNPFEVRSTFWNRMLAGTKADADESSGYVRMPREVALRYHGGTVKPKKAKMLAIPARAEAYGKSPRQFNDLRFVPTGRGKGMLVQNEQTQIVRHKSGKKKGQVKELREIAGDLTYFFLVPQVTIKADPNVLPTDSMFLAAAMRGVQTYITLQMRRNNR